MKIHYTWLLLTALIAGLGGGLIGKISESRKTTHQASVVGQTLADLAKALEAEKKVIGHYPDSISHLRIVSESSEFSKTILADTLYQKTKDGYIALVGLPNVAYVQPKTAVKFKSTSERDLISH